MFDTLCLGLFQIYLRQSLVLLGHFPMDVPDPSHPNTLNIVYYTPELMLFANFNAIFVTNN